MRTVFSFSVGSPRRKGRRVWIHLAKVFRCAAMRAMVRSEKRRLPSASSSFRRASRNARDRRLVQSERSSLPSSACMKREEAPEVAALHRPGALRRWSPRRQSRPPASRRGSRRCRPRDRGAPAGGTPRSCCFRSRIPRPHFPHHSFVKRFGAVLELLRGMVLGILVTKGYTKDTFCEAIWSSQSPPGRAAGTVGHARNGWRRDSCSGADRRCFSAERLLLIQAKQARCAGSAAASALLSETINHGD